MSHLSNPSISASDELSFPADSLIEAAPPASSLEGSPTEPIASRCELDTRGLGGFTATTDLARCLVPLLDALKWRGLPRHISEALPHFADELDLSGFLHTMAHLNFASRSVKVNLKDLDQRIAPCLFVPDAGSAAVITSIDPGENGERQFTIFTGMTAMVDVLVDPASTGTVWTFHPVADEAVHVRESRIGWFRGMLDRFRGLIWQTLFVSTLLSFITLIAPLFVMAIYDKVIMSRSIDILASILIGASIALAGDAMLRVIRARMIAHFGARIGYLVGTAVFQRILSLPSGLTERANIGSQIARLRDFESVRDFFTGPLAMSFFELPFVAVQILVMFVLGGIVALVPLGSMLLFAAIAMSLMPLVRNRGAESSKAETKRQEFLVEALTKLRGLKTVGAEMTWADRYRDFSANSALGSYRTAQATNLISTLAHAVVVSSGILTLMLGVHEVLAGNMTVGALIACMIMVWRALAPLQTGFMMISQIERIRASTRQIDNLMRMKPERDLNIPVRMVRSYQGRVSFNRVSMRYASDSDPALVGVSFDARPGQVVAIVGPNGCGKSTLLKLIAGLYAPQAGSVLVDGNDIRQLDPAELRQAVGYVPQVRRFFHGTIAQNLRLVKPNATDAEIREATEMSGAYHEIMALPEGFSTRIGDARNERLSSSLLQKISLARAYLKKPAILLCDEAASGLDYEGDAAFMDVIKSLRGITTVFLVTHRPSHLKLADGIIVMEAGTIRMAGPASQVINKIPKELL